MLFCCRTLYARDRTLQRQSFGRLITREGWWVVWTQCESYCRTITHSFIGGGTSQHSPSIQASLARVHAEAEVDGGNRRQVAQRSLRLCCCRVVERKVLREEASESWREISSNRLSPKRVTEKRWVVPLVCNYGRLPKLGRSRQNGGVVLGSTNTHPRNE